MRRGEEIHRGKRVMRRNIEERGDAQRERRYADERELRGGT
jgi:hypothetical protein